MFKKCKKHDRRYCALCRDDDNASQIGMTNTGVSIGLGGGLGIDPSDGSLTIGGIDTDGGSFGGFDSGSSDSGGFDGGGGGDFGGGGSSGEW